MLSSNRKRDPELMFLDKLKKRVRGPHRYRLDEYPDPENTLFRKATIPNSTKQTPSNPIEILTPPDDSSPKTASTNLVKNEGLLNLTSPKTFVDLAQTCDDTSSDSMVTRSDSIVTDHSVSSQSSFASASARNGITGVSNLSVGCKLYVEVIKGKIKRDKKEFRKAEILAIREDSDGNNEYYVHIELFNKRLDEWVSIDRFDISQGIEWPEILDEKNDDLRKIECPLRSNHQPNDASSNADISRVRNIEKIQFGEYLIDTWYFSPYPEEYSQYHTIYICEFCLFHFACEKQLRRHAKKCTIRHPPGNEIYRDDNVSFFEIDGRRQLAYCRNLALLSKLFLDHKDLKYDIDVFLFYIMCKFDDYGAHIIGYFSKEKHCETNYNLSCILTLPQHQRKGYGKLLISFSYELSKREGQIGTPERPLSDLGLTSYYSYWQEVILDICMEAAQTKKEISIEEISVRTCIDTEDVISTLYFLNAFREYKRQIAIILDHKLVALREKIKTQGKLSIDEKNFDPRYKKAY